MSFMDSKFSKWGEVETAVLSQSLAKRFARVMLAAVLAASFLPVAAFADEGGTESQDTPLLLSTEDGSNDGQENGGKGRSSSAISGPNQIKYYMTAQYTNIFGSGPLWTVELSKSRILIIFIQITGPFL